MFQERFYNVDLKLSVLLTLAPVFNMLSSLVSPIYLSPRHYNILQWGGQQCSGCRRLHFVHDDKEIMEAGLSIREM